MVYQPKHILYIKKCRESCGNQQNLIDNPHLSTMNMWQIENLTQHQEKCEHQIKRKRFISKGSFTRLYILDNKEHLTHGHMKKTRGIKKIYMKLIILRQQEKVQD